jgi:two-component system capsular synthesis response regulator RcsB
MAFLQEIYIADDHEAVWLGVRAALSFSEFKVVAQCRDHDEVAARLIQHVPDALILDFTMPGTAFPDGMGYLQQACNRYPSLPVMVLTMTRRPVLLQGMLDAGARALVDKSASLSALAEALRSIVAGGTYVSDSFVGLGEGEPGNPDEQRLVGYATLTHQERRVVSSLSDGNTLAETGRILGSSISTVSTLKRRAMLKLGMRSMHDLRDYWRQP